ncbi:MAG TPA: hypothetical protein VF048_05590 [Gemmatimonadaceae bacterium]
MARQFPARVRAGLLAVALAALPLAATPPAVLAQAVETPAAFDSAGRVLAITPIDAARARLGPPAWRVTGDFDEARLFSLGDGRYVLTVTRPSGAVERYGLTAADVATLRARLSGLRIAPRDDRRAGERGTARGARNRFIVEQSLLGLTVYAPSFALAVTNEDAGRAASYLLVSGMSYFGASALSRDITITPAQNRLATHAALHGAAAGLGTGVAFDLPNDGRAALAFGGGLAGTAAGLYFARTMTSDEVAASSLGADVAALAALGITTGVDADIRTVSGAMVAAGLAGYPLGLLYARSVPHNVTAGDATVLAFSTGVGAVAALPFLVDADGDERVLGVTLGGLAGLVAGDRLLVGRYDHSQSEGTLVGLGAAAGGLMGAGVATLIDDEDNDRLVASLAAAGAVIGMGVSEVLLVPSPDARRFAAGLRFDPTGLALAAAGVPGRHTLLRVTF